MRTAPRPVRRLRRSGPAAVAVALLLAAAGCGSSDDGRPTDRTPTATSGESGEESGAAGGAKRSASDAPPLDPLPEKIPANLRPYYEQELDWGPCEGATDTECAKLTVPMDYDNPRQADDQQIAVTRLPAADESSRIGSLVTNPGGPGSSAVEFVQAAASYVFPAQILDRYDVVGFDPRGTGGSMPLQCLDGPEMDEHTETDRTPDDAAEVDQLIAAMEEFGAGCQADAGELLGHISTIEAARDMDVLRAVLGDEQLTYVGFSYGTKLGAVYAGLFPQRAGRLVLDSAMDPRLSTLETDREQAGGFEVAFRSFASDCATYDDCALGTGTPDDASRRLLDFFAAVDAEPLPTGDPDRPLTESLATTGVAAALYADTMWPELRGALDDALNEGDGAGLLVLADSYNERLDDSTYGTIMFAFPAISCLDSPAGAESPAEVREHLASYNEASPTFGAEFAWATLQCGVWPVEPTGQPVSIAAAGSNDIVVIGTTRDPATPYQWAEGLAEQLESGILLTHDGDGHGGYAIGNACIDDAVNAYLLEGTSPEAGTTC